MSPSVRWLERRKQLLAKEILRVTRTSCAAHTHQILALNPAIVLFSSKEFSLHSAPSLPSPSTTFATSDRSAPRYCVRRELSLSAEKEAFFSEGGVLVGLEKDELPTRFYSRIKQYKCQRQTVRQQEEDANWAGSELSRQAPPIYCQQLNSTQAYSPRLTWRFCLRLAQPGEAASSWFYLSPYGLNWQYVVAENNQLMGCGPQAKVPSLTRSDTLIGVLRVTVVEAQFPPQAVLKDPSVKIRVSNQQFATKSLGVLQKDHKVNESFSFTINSFYKAEGRAIEAGVFDGKTFVAYGAVDANPIISSATSGQTHDFRLILASDKEKKFGHVLLQVRFEELPNNELTFRFESATIRRKHGDRKVSVRVTIGEEVLQTEYREDLLQAPPIWKDQMLNFKVPEGLSKGLLQLINAKGEEIGSGWVDLSTLLQSKPGDEVFVAQELFFKDEEKEVDAANLKYSYIVGEKASFSLIPDIMRSSVRGIRAKNELDQPVVLERPK